MNRMEKLVRQKTTVMEKMQKKGDENRRPRIQVNARGRAVECYLK